MPAPELYLAAHPALLCAINLLLFTVSCLLYVLADRRRARLPNIQADPVLPLRARLLRPALGAAVFLSLTLAFTGTLRAFFGGAFLVIQLANIGQNVSSLLVEAALARPGATQGHLVYSPSAQARIMSSTIVSSSVLCFGASALAVSPAFFGAGLFLATTALGYRRRANQYAAMPIIN
jgi:hypothetical protein